MSQLHRKRDEILDVDYITVEELRRLHPSSKPLPENKEEAECHNCGKDFGEEWEERKRLKPIYWSLLRSKVFAAGRGWWRRLIVVGMIW